MRWNYVMLNEPTPDFLNQMPPIGEAIHTPLDEKIIYLHSSEGGYHWFGTEFDPDKEAFFGFIARRDIAHSSWGEFALYELRLANIRHRPRVHLDQG